MTALLLTGGTGTLGRAIVAAADPGDVRILSRQARQASGQDWARADLLTGDGLDAALNGVQTIVHCASNPRGGDARMTRMLVDAARRSATPPHLVYISIVGVDRIPLGYYREKLWTERVVQSSGLPWTILRATQFHQLVFSLFDAQRRMPVVFSPRIRLQPIAVEDVAGELLRLAAGPAVQRAADIGGPQILTAAEIARNTFTALGVQRRIASFRLPGAAFAALRAGDNLVPGNRFGRATYSDFLAARLR